MDELRLRVGEGEREGDDSFRPCCMKAARRRLYATATTLGANTSQNLHNYDLQLLTPLKTRSDDRYVPACSHYKRVPSL